MANASYMPLVYMLQGGDVQVVASGGEVTIESGGLITAESGGGFKIESGGSLDLESGGGIDVQSGGDITVESGGSVIFPASGATSSASGSTTLTEFANSGVSFVTSSGDVRKFTIAAPTLGCVKTIFATAGTTGMVHYYSVGSAGIISTGASSTAHMLVNEGTTSSALSAWVSLVGLSTSRWLVTAHSPTSQWVVVSTSS